ncbi:MAG TPA: anhydro-N-acetylmuramic acid kinase [Candidatus Corynebacterium avicola]|uniref:Anhydro-N-acetylmuramic acid kinase n=1 Tax=Candidatus Corynebacterium avicola TaxID=2838527 RepID=A0A9D1RSA5_9CORY|nr:anhydro-N-acetylmuramic acid kinase [Candidatus Corynebacterium avicola]
MIIAGLMTGTSADALDVALVEFGLVVDDTNSVTATEGGELTMRLLAFRAVPFDQELQHDILRLLNPEPIELQLVSSVDARLGQACADAVSHLNSETGVACDLVVSHGQTVRHDIADGKVTSTLQLGQPAWIAETTGSPVLSDIRARDVASGGQGAPLVGILDHLLMSGNDTPTAMLNLGGIANITVVAPGEEPVAFDTGPANALIDVMARHINGDSHSIDRDGALAARGTVDHDLLTQLLADPYYTLPAPKSTGKEHFHQEYLREQLQGYPDVDDLDVIATVTALTANTVADACHAHGVKEVVASGGGTRNPTLMAQLQEYLGPEVTLKTTDQVLGLHEGAKEACLMALLGWLSWHGLDATLPSLTGADHGTIAGRFSPGGGPLRLPTPLDQMPSHLRVLQ